MSSPSHPGASGMEKSKGKALPPLTVSCRACVSVEWHCSYCGTKGTVIARCSRHETDSRPVQTSQTVYEERADHEGCREQLAAELKLAKYGTTAPSEASIYSSESKNNGLERLGRAAKLKLKKSTTSLRKAFGKDEVPSPAPPQEQSRLKRSISLGSLRMGKKSAAEKQLPPVPAVPEKYR